MSNSASSLTPPARLAKLNSQRSRPPSSTSRNPPVVTGVDANGVAHVNYGFRGPSKKLLVCLSTARASLKVEFTIDREVPIREPQN